MQLGWFAAKQLCAFDALRESAVLGDAKESISFRILMHLLQDDRE